MRARHLAGLIAAFALVACGHGASVSSVTPDTGVIWFGQAITATTLPTVVDRSSTFAQGTTIAFLAHLDRPTTNETLGLLVLGGGSLGTDGLGPVAPGQTLFSGVVSHFDFGGPAAYTVAVVDSSGAHLADGSLTITP